MPNDLGSVEEMLQRLRGCKLIGMAYLGFSRRKPHHYLTEALLFAYRMPGHDWAIAARSRSARPEGPVVEFTTHSSPDSKSVMGAMAELVRAAGACAEQSGADPQVYMLEVDLSIPEESQGLRDEILGLSWILDAAGPVPTVADPECN